MKKYGVEHFHVSLLEKTDNPNEREIYWIEKKQSFKNGYNATIGGDGKRYLDYDLICATYEQVHNKTEVARILNCSPDSVGKILKERNIDITPSSLNQKSKIVNQYNKNTKEYIQSFSGLREAARVLIDAGITTSRVEGVSSHIREAANGKRKSAYGFIWKFN